MNHLNLLTFRWHVTYHWKAFDKGYNFALEFCTKSYGFPKSQKSQFWKFWDSQLGSLETKWHVGAGPMARHREYYYKGEGGGFPQVREAPSSGYGGSCESLFVHGSSMHQKCSNYALTNLFDLCRSMWIIDLLFTRPSPHPGAPTCPSTLKCYELGSIPQLLILPMFSPWTCSWVYQRVWRCITREEKKMAK